MFIWVFLRVIVRQVLRGSTLRTRNAFFLCRFLYRTKIFPARRFTYLKINFFTMTTHVIEEELQEKFACCSWELSLILLQVQDSLFADTVTLQLKKVPPFSCHVGFQDSRAP